MSKFNIFINAFKRTSQISNCLRSRTKGARYASTATAVKPSISGELSPSMSQTGEKVYPQHISNIVDQIGQLNLLEVSELNELIRKKFKIESSMAMSVMSTGANAGSKEVIEEVEEVIIKSSFNVKLMKFDPSKKVALIKEIKSLLPEMNLVQAKTFVESSPAFVKKDLSKDEAEALKKALEAAGATVDIE